MPMYNCVSKGSLGNTEVINSERNLFKKEHVLYRTLFFFERTAEEQDCGKWITWYNTFLMHDYLSVIAMSEPGISSCNDINPNNKSL